MHHRVSILVQLSVVLPVRCPLITRCLLHSGGESIWFEQDTVMGKSTRVLHRLLVGDAPSAERARVSFQVPDWMHTAKSRTRADSDSELLSRFTDGKSLTFDKVGLCKALESLRPTGRPAAMRNLGSEPEVHSNSPSGSDASSSGSDSDSDSDSDDESAGESN